MIYSLLLVIIAGILNAYMDKWMIKYQLLDETEEYKVNSNWWSYNPLAKWKDGKWGTEKADNIILYKLFKIKTKWLSDICNDGWHTFKSIMIVCLLSSVVLANYHNEGIIGKIIELIILGLAWNLPFNLIFNNKIKFK